MSLRYVSSLWVIRTRCIMKYQDTRIGDYSQIEAKAKDNAMCTFVGELSNLRLEIIFESFGISGFRDLFRDVVMVSSKYF